MLKEAASHTTANDSTERALLGRRRGDETRYAGSASDARAKAAVLDEVYDEYCRLRDAGETIDRNEFACRYSRYQRSILLMLDVHRFIEYNPELLADSPETAWPEVGDDYLGFKLLDELGQGSFARVFLAAENDLGGRLVAVKIAWDNADEALLIARLGGHRNVVPVHSVRTDPTTGRTLICMPYVGRATLCDLLDRVIDECIPYQSPRMFRRGQDSVFKTAKDLLSEVLQTDERYPVSDAAKDQDPPPRSYLGYVQALGAALADALAHTHKLGVCHGDLKPSNVLLVGGGRPMLVDFNLSLEIGDVSRLGGTLPYIAPEQLQALVEARHGRTWNALDERCDLFSLGAILYELLTGKLPFGHPVSDAPLSVISEELLRLRRAGPRPIRELNPQVDRHTARTVERCLRFDPTERPQSAQELAKSLRRAASPLARCLAWIDRHRSLVGTFTIAFALFACGLGAWLANRPTLAEREYGAAVDLFKKGDREAALPAVTKAIDANNDYLDAYFLRGQIRLAMGQYSVAETDFSTVGSRSDNGLAHAASAFCLAMRKQADRAIVESQEAMRCGYHSAALANNLAYCYRLQGKWDETIRWATKAIELNDRLQPAFHTRAIAIADRFRRLQTGMMEQAASDIGRAIELGPASAELFLNAACIEIGRTKANPQHVSIAPMYLADAVRLGTPMASIKYHPWLKNVALPAMEDIAPSTKRSAEFLVDPFATDGS